jgi:hypothetical protein
MVTRSQFDLNA